MKCIILAAGYATRLYPLTKDKPKPLLDVAGKTILDHIMEKVAKVPEIDEVIIVSNAKFYDQFIAWSKEARYAKTITVLNDGTTSNEIRLGAIRDIQSAIDELAINEDIMVLAGDNLFDFELTDFVEYFQKVGTDCITAYKETDEAQLKRAGVVELDTSGKVLSFEEKPEDPKSDFAVPAFYIYKKETLPLFKKYLDEGNNPDAPGHFVPWLINKKSVHAWILPGKRYDIGTLESYKRVQEIFANR